MKKILQWLHRKIDGKSICLIFTALFFLTVSLFTALIISLYSEYTKAQIAAFLQEKNTQQLRRMSFSIEEDVDDTIALANTAYYQIIKSTDLQALLTEQTLSDFCQLHENKILYAAIYDIDGALLWQNAENYDAESADSAAWFQAAETEIDTVAFDVPHYIQTAAGFQKAMTVSRYVELQDGGKSRSGILRFDVCMDNMEAELNIYPASHALCGPWRSRGLFASGAAERRFPVCF